MSASNQNQPQGSTHEPFMDQALIDQLKGAFANLKNEMVLITNPSSSSSGPEAVDPELRAMLEGLVASNPKIKLKTDPEYFRGVAASSSNSPKKYFEIARLDTSGSLVPTGISYTGIPGGHEFTSLVLAILNGDGQGKLPDAGVQSRILKLQGPIKIETYVSLTCENCPDVVQALQQMALIHPQFEHQMVEGSVAQEQIDKLGIQGVPAVFAVDPQGKHTLLHSGRSHFLDLFQKLESHFGTSSNESEPRFLDAVAKPAPSGPQIFDVLVLGGGPAGVSAAIYTARKGLKTGLIAERMGGQVQDTKGIENLISVPYTEGPKLAQDLYKHLSHYDITLLDQRRVHKVHPKKDGYFWAEIEGYSEGSGKLLAKTVIVATGAQWRKLNVPGEIEYLGQGVAYCPHCDGPFYKGKSIIVVGGGNSGVEAAIDLAQIAGTVTVLEFQGALKADKILVDKLHSFKNTKVITHAKTLQINGDGKKVTGLTFENQTTQEKTLVPIDGVFIQIGLIPNSGCIKELIKTTSFGEIEIDAKTRTSVPGIFAAGDVTTVPYKQIVIAMGEGSKAGLSAFEYLMFGG